MQALHVYKCITRMKARKSSFFCENKTHIWITLIAWRLRIMWIWQMMEGIEKTRLWYVQSYCYQCNRLKKIISEKIYMHIIIQFKEVNKSFRKNARGKHITKQLLKPSLWMTTGQKAASVVQVLFNWSPLSLSRMKSSEFYSSRPSFIVQVLVGSMSYIFFILLNH